MADKPAMLVGRAEEMHRLRSMVIGARNGMSGALVIRGEPGIGKTTLLSATIGATPDVRLIRIEGYEAEASIPYAGLQRLGIVLRQFESALSPRHARALHVAWGHDDGAAPDPFLVGLAMLALLASAGGQAPTLCVIDDAHWLDAESLSVLAFVARRLTAESTALIFAVRDSEQVDVALAGIESLYLEGLDQRAAVELLSRVLPAGFDPVSAVQIAAATGGHPLVLTDLGRDLSLRQINDLTLSNAPFPVTRRLESHYLRQVRRMSADVQTWLLITAIGAGGPRGLLERCAARLELSADCAEQAVRAGLVAVRDVVEFRHPLVRSAIYGASPAPERRRCHALLAEAAADLGLIELEAWHAAEAAVGADSGVAHRLQQVAESAGRRGALVSRSRLLTRAADLTAQPSQRNERYLTAAEAAGAGGAARLSQDLLDRIDAGQLDRVQRGRLLSVQAATAMFLADPAAVRRGTVRMLEAADFFRGADAHREQQALIQAFEHCLVVESGLQDTTLKKLGRRLECGAHSADGIARVVLEALSALVLLPYADSAPLARRALDALLTLDTATLPDFGFVGIAFAMALFDAASAETYLSRLATTAREAGALRTLDTVLWIRSSLDTGRGDPAAAALHIEQVRELRRAIGYQAENVVNSSYLAWTDESTETVDAIAALTSTMGFDGVSHAADAMLAVREVAEGRYGNAYSRLARLQGRPFLHVTNLELANLVEAAVRSGHREHARQAVAALDELAAVNAAPWLHGLNQRSHALLADDPVAPAHYEAAIDHLTRAAAPADLGRAHLLYGEWLRRKKRRRHAREQLRAAVVIFDRVEAIAFARRARSELSATGEQISTREVVAGVEMSPREATVARMAAAGETNADIAATLFITVNTVDYHLRKVFVKLGVSSRRQLRERFDSRG